jgi:transcriptional regulator NrdR family protein
MSACPDSDCGRLKTVVYETRTVACGWIRRRRKCDCGQRWQTYELADWEIDLSERDPADLRVVPRESTGDA